MHQRGLESQGKKCEVRSIERNWFEEGGKTITEDKLVTVSEILVCESALQVFFTCPTAGA